VKSTIKFFSLFLLTLGANAQNNLSVLYDQHWNLHGSKYIPSKLGDDYGTFNATILNGYAYINNSGFGLDALNQTNNEKINKALDQMAPNNILGAGTEIDLIGMSYKLKRRDKEFMSFSFFATERIGSNFLYTKDFFDLVWNGNAKFENKRADLTIGSSTNWLREYAIGWSMPIDIPSVGDDVKIKIGARLKYLQGFGAISFPKSNVAFITGANGRSLTFETDYVMNIAGYDGTDWTKNPLTAKGSGFGIDLSGTVSFLKNFEASLSVIDIGSVKYNKETYQFARKSNIEFSGIPIGDIIKGGNFDVQNYISTEFKGNQIAASSFNMALPTRLIMQGEWKTQKNTKKKNREFYDKRACVTYIQGFNNMPGATTKPFISAGYNHSLNYVLNAGATLSYGGYGRFGFGVNGSVRFGGFRFGLGTTNLFGTTNLYGSGLDITFLTSITI